MQLKMIVFVMIIIGLHFTVYCMINALPDTYTCINFSA